MEFVILAFILLIGPLAVAFGADSRPDDQRRPPGLVAHRLAARRTAKVWAALGAIYLIWGSTYLGMEIAIETLPPFLMASIRFLVAGTILYAIFRPRERPTRAQWLWAARRRLVPARGRERGRRPLAAVDRHRRRRADRRDDAALARARERDRHQAAAGRAGARRARDRLRRDRAAGPSGRRHRPASARSCACSRRSRGRPARCCARRAALPANLLLGTGMQMLAGGALLAVIGLASGERVDFAEVSRPLVALGRVPGRVRLDRRATRVTCGC